MSLDVRLAAPPDVLRALDAGEVRAAYPDPAAPDGWHVDGAVQEAILGLFADRATQTWEAGPFQFRDRVGLPVKALLEGPEASAALAAGRPWRVVPGERRFVPAPTWRRASRSCRPPS